jgi:hypothetical protein
LDITIAFCELSPQAIPCLASYHIFPELVE